jgi:photosystem II stability/assembly factor-like uncharacterized protein
MAIIIVNAQDWKENLPVKNGKAYTLKEYQDAFNTYWNEFNVVNGKYYNENRDFVKAPGWKQFRRWEHFWESRVDPNTGTFPDIDYKNINETFRENQNMRNTGGNWSNLGPSSSIGGYAGLGRLNCIQFHPSDANTMWVGAASGGIWVTTNGGSSWSVLNDNEQVLGVSDIVIPSNYATSNTIYIATGDRDALDNRSIGVLKSTDGGSTWNSTGLSFTVQQGVRATRLLLDPNDDQTIIAATSSGVYKTTDGAISWNLLSPNYFIDMEYKPGDYSKLYGSTTSGQIYYSTDGGSNWTLAHTAGNRIELAVSPDEPNWVYAVVAASNNGLYGVYRSTNEGQSYIRQYDGLLYGNNLLGWNSDGTDSGGQGWYDLSIAVDPTNASTVYVGGVNTWKSTDNGLNWSINNHWYGANGIAEVHADQHMLKYNQNTGVLFECNDGGLYKSTDGTNWSFISEGLEISQMYKLGVSASVNEEIITGLQDNGTKLLSGGAWDDVKGGDGMECIIDYTDVNTQYGTYVYGQIDRTTNHWATAIDISANIPGGNNGAWVTPYLIDPINHETLYVGYEDVWKTTNQGNSFTKIGDFSDGTLRSMAISQSDPNYIYIATLYKIQRTTNGGTSWEVITNNLPVGSASISYIAVKHDDPNTVWVTLSSYNSHGAYVTTNGGASWTDISSGLPSIPVNTIVENRQNTSETELYAGTDAGTYIKEGDNAWELFSSGLPNVIVSELEIYYDDVDQLNSRLYAATYGRGLWVSELNSLPVGYPTVTTGTPQNITTNSCDINGEVTDDAGFAVSERGFVYSLNPAPTINDNKVSVGSGTGTFNTTITGLDAGVNYYIRAYATNTNGTSYGGQQNFTTLCETLEYTAEQDFESADFPPLCWDSFIGDNGVGTNKNWTTSPSAYSGSQAAFVRYEDVVGGTAEDWLVSSQVILGNNSQMSFYEKQEYGAEYGTLYNIKVSTGSQNNPDDFTTVESYTESELNLLYTERIVDLSAYDGQQIYVAFVMYNDNGDNWYIDQIDITSDTPSAPQATANAVPGCNNGAVVISSNMSGEQTFYLTDEVGNVLESATEDASSHEFTTLADGNYAGKVEKLSQMSPLSDVVTLTNETAPTQPSSITGSDDVCEGSEQTYSVTDVDGIDYNWTIPGGWTGSSTSNSITLIVGNTGGTISVTPENSCGEGPPQILEVEVTNLPEQPSEIDGPQTVCVGNEAVYSVENITGVEFNWTLPDGWTGNSVLNSITVIAGSNSGEITVSTVNDCGTSDSQSLGVAVQDIPEPVSEINGPTSICEETEHIYSVINVPGTTYLWELPDGWTGTSETNEITVTTGTSGGTITVTPSNDCGNGTSSSLAVEIITAPDQPSAITGLTEVCENTTQTYSVTLVSDVTYEWNLPTGWSGFSESNTIIAEVGSNSGTITVNATNDCGSSESQELYVEVRNLPSQAPAISGPASVYQGDDAVPFEITQITNAESYTWTLHPSWILNSGQGTTAIIVDFPDEAVSGVLSVYGTNQCGNGISSNLTLDVLPIGIKDLEEAGIKVYPVPTNNLIHIEMSSTKQIIENVQVANSNGQILIQKIVKNSKTELDMTKLAAGTYFLRIEVDGKLYQSKILKFN